MSTAKCYLNIQLSMSTIWIIEFMDARRKRFSYISILVFQYLLLSMLLC